jgi:outer membrane lipoprotein-sorting protein
VVISDYLKEDQVSWVNLFLDRSLIESSYNFNQKKLNNGETHIRFDDMKGDYKSVTLIFKSGFLQGINLIDKTANSISIEFTKFEINQTLSDNLFNYQFPSSADIIDQRR